MALLCEDAEVFVAVDIERADHDANDNLWFVLALWLARLAKLEVVPTRGSNHSRDCDWGFPKEGVVEAILCLCERELAQHLEKDVVVVVLVVCRVRLEVEVQGGRRQILGAAVVG